MSALRTGLMAAHVGLMGARVYQGHQGRKDRKKDREERRDFQEQRMVLAFSLHCLLTDGIERTPSAGMQANSA